MLGKMLKKKLWVYLKNGFSGDTLLFPPPPWKLAVGKAMGDVVAERKGTQCASPAKQVEEHDGNWLEEWEDDEDISWGVLEQDQDHEEEEENANNQFVVTNYCISGRNIAIKQQPQLGIAHQVWHAVCNR